MLPQRKRELNHVFLWPAKDNRTFYMIVVHVDPSGEFSLRGDGVKYPLEQLAHCQRELEKGGLIGEEIIPNEALVFMADGGNFKAALEALAWGYFELTVKGHEPNDATH